MLSIVLDMLLYIVASFADVPRNGWPNCDYDKFVLKNGMKHRLLLLRRPEMFVPTSRRWTRRKKCACVSRLLSFAFFFLLLVVTVMGRGRQSKVAVQRDNVDNKTKSRFSLRVCMGVKVWKLCGCPVGDAEVELWAAVVCPL